MFLDSRDRLNRKGETARSLEEYRICLLLITSDLF